MSKHSKRSVHHSSKLCIKTTVGDVLAAALDAADGRADAAARLLTRADFDRLLSGRHFRFI
jgi:hypothetical protein